VAGPERTTPQALLRVIVDEFEEQGWRHINGLPALIVTQCQERGALDAGEAAELADSRFLARNQTDRDSLQRTLERAFANRLLTEPTMNEPTVKQEITIQSYGDNARFGDVTQTGQQITLNLDSPHDAVLGAVGDLVRRGLDGRLFEPDLADLAGLVEARGDIDQGEIETVVGEVIAEVEPEPGKIAKLRDAVLTGAATSLLVQGVLAVLAAL
jgi:hypothetical protein